MKNNMREIVFRGKRTDNNEWVEGSLIYSKASVGTDDLAIIIESCEWDNTQEWFSICKSARVIPKTIGQYTGLTDKNGKKIFEGDIIKYTRTHWNEPLHTDNGKDLISLHEIYYDKNQAAFKQLHVLQCQETRNPRQYAYRVIGSGLISSFDDSRAEENIIEVVGNIHDNTEFFLLVKIVDGKDE